MRHIGHAPCKECKRLRTRMESAEKERDMLKVALLDPVVDERREGKYIVPIRASDMRLENAQLRTKTLAFLDAMHELERAWERPATPEPSDEETS